MFSKLKNKKLRYTSIIGVSAIVVIITLTVYANNVISSTSANYLYDDINKVSPVKVGLLLGTSNKLSNGSANDFFYFRIEAAVELYQQGKIKSILVSGDNSKSYYNEPQEMKKELIKRGVPDSVIYLDYAGFRTLDSVIRAREIFGQNSYVVISQKFHNERAVFIARKNGIEAFGFNAKEVTAYKGFKTKIREYFARDKVFVDFIFGVQPKFKGERINIK